LDGRPSVRDQLRMSTRLIVHLVHGTWPEGVWVSLKRWARPGLAYTPEQGDAFWFQSGHEFRERLATSLSNAGFAPDFRPFVWSGANSFAARADAAEGLVPHLVAGMHDGARQLIIAHSHGGTVAMLAMRLVELGQTPGSFTDGGSLRWAPARRHAGNAVTIRVEDIVEMSAQRVRDGVADLELVTLATPFLRVEPFGSGKLLWAAFAICWMTAFAAMALAITRTYGEAWAYAAMFVASVVVGLVARLIASARGFLASRIVALQACRFIGKRIQCIRGVADEAELTISAGIIGCNLVRTLLVFAGRWLAKASIRLVLGAYLAAIAIFAVAMIAAPGSQLVVWLYAFGAAALAFIALLAFGSSLQSLLGLELAVCGFDCLRHAVYLHPYCARHISAGLNVARSTQTRSLPIEAPSSADPDVNIDIDIGIGLRATRPPP
jgi:hypothetical protein